MAPHPIDDTTEVLVILKRYAGFRSDEPFDPAAEGDLEHCRAVLLHAAGRDARILRAAEVVERALRKWRVEDTRATAADASHACSILSAL